MRDPRRVLPSVGSLLESEPLQALLRRAPRSLVTNAIRAAIDEARRAPDAAPRDEGEWAEAVSRALLPLERPSLRPVLNATGVVLHTNLGRAPLPEAAVEAIRRTALGFSNLEYDLERGARGSRYTHAVALLRELTGAEDALVVNNCAAALVLALAAFADGRTAVVSRGELVEIGGSFRIPDIMAESGAALREVGTTNRTHLDDYRGALDERAGIIVKVHRSNFAIEGFTAEVPVEQLVPLARERGVPVLHDLGSGLLVALDAYGLRGEPTASEAVRSGATLVTMSGDKLLGGPQAGIVLGSADAVGELRRHPLARAFRVDKLTLAALEATLALYRDPERALSDVPVLAMLTVPAERVRQRAEKLAEWLALHGVGAAVVPTMASVGGGAFPTQQLPSFAVALAGDAPALERRLRLAQAPVIGRIAEDRLLLDLRSVPPSHADALAAAVVAALS